MYARTHAHTPSPNAGNTEEYEDGALTGNLGEVLIRCNNVLYIRVSELAVNIAIHQYIIFVEPPT